MAGRLAQRHVQAVRRAQPHAIGARVQPRRLPPAHVRRLRPHPAPVAPRRRGGRRAARRRRGRRPAASAGADEAYDSDIAPDFAPAEALNAPPLKSRGGSSAAIAPSRRAFLEASSLQQAARASAGDGLPSALLSEPSPLGALSASTSLLAIDELVQKSRFHAIRPWLRGLEPPSASASRAPPSERAPLESLDLVHVHGARTHDVRSQVQIAKSGEVIYPSAALVVLLSPPDATGGGGASGGRRQRYYKRHSSAVLSTAMHPAGTIVASGALGREPALHVWDTTSLQPLAVLPGATHSGASAPSPSRPTANTSPRATTPPRRSSRCGTGGVVRSWRRRAPAASACWASPSRPAGCSSATEPARCASGRPTARG